MIVSRFRGKGALGLGSQSRGPPPAGKDARSRNGCVIQPVAVPAKSVFHGYRHPRFTMIVSRFRDKGALGLGSQSQRTASGW